MGLSKGEFDSIMESLGSDPQQAERFINVFSHAVSGSEFFGRVNASDLLGREPASFDRRQLQQRDRSEGVIQR